MNEITKYITISLLVILSNSACEKNDAPEMTESESIDRADEVLRDYAEFVRSKEFIRVDIKSSSEMGSTTKGMNSSSIYDLAVARPDRFSFKLTSGLTGISMVANSEKVQIWNAPHFPENQVISELTPETESPFDKRVIGGMNASLIRLVFFWRSIVERNPDEYIKSTFHEIRYKGIRDLDGSDCHCLGMRIENFELDVYFDTGEAAILRKVEGEFVDNANDSVMRKSVTFKNWRFDKIDDSVFRIPSPHAPDSGADEARPEDKNNGA